MLYQHCQVWIEVWWSFISWCCANFLKFSCREHFKQKPFQVFIVSAIFVAHCQHYMLQSASSIYWSASARFSDAQAKSDNHKSSKSLWKYRSKKTASCNFAKNILNPVMSDQTRGFVLVNDPFGGAKQDLCRDVEDYKTYLWKIVLE